MPGLPFFLTRFLNTVLIGAACLVMTGCGAFTLDLSFPEINGLTKGAPVFFQQSRVGSVTHIAYTDSGRFMVTVEVVSGFEAAFTEHARFEIVSSPLKEDEKAIIMTHAEEGGRRLETGETIEALPPSVFQELAPMGREFSRRMNRFFDTLKEVPESRQFQEFERAVDELTQKMKAAGTSARDKIQNEILPRLEKELDALKKRFKDLDRPEPDTRTLEKKLEDLQQV